MSVHHAHTHHAASHTAHHAAHKASGAKHTHTHATHKHASTTHHHRSTPHVQAIAKQKRIIHLHVHSAHPRQDRWYIG